MSKDAVFTNPSWKPLTVVDFTPYVNTMRAINNEAEDGVKSLIQGYSDALKSAEEKHQRNIVNTINHLTPEQLSSADFMSVINNKINEQSEAFGGYHNLTQLDKLIKDRLPTARQEVQDAFNYEVGDANRVMLPMLQAAVTQYTDPTGFTTAEDKDAAYKVLVGAVASMNDPNSGLTNGERSVLSDFIGKLPDGIIKGVTSSKDLDAAIGELDYRRHHNGMGDQILERMARIQAAIDTSSPDDPSLPKLQEALTMLQGLENTFLSTLSPKGQSYYHATSGAKKEKLYTPYAKQFSAARLAGVKEGQLDLQKQIAEQGSWYQQATIELGKESNAIEAYRAMNPPSNGTSQNTYNTDGGDPIKVNPNSFSGSEVVQKQYAELGIAQPVIKGDDGRPTLNKSGILNAINVNLSGEKIQLDLGERYQKALLNPAIKNSEWFSSGSIEGKYNSDLSDHRIKVGNTTRPLTEAERKYVFIRAVETGESGNWWKRNTQKASLINSWVDEYNLEVRSNQSKYLQQVISTLSTDTGLSQGQIINELGLMKEYGHLLTQNQKDAAYAANSKDTQFQQKPPSGAPISQGGYAVNIL